MRQSTRESVLESCNNVQTMSADTAGKIAQGWRKLAVFSRQLNPHNTDLHRVYDKLAEMFEARANEQWRDLVYGYSQNKTDGPSGLEFCDEDSLTTRESYDRETRGTFDVEGRVRS